MNKYWSWFQIVTSLRTIIKNILSLLGVAVLAIFTVYDDEEFNIIFKIIVILSPLLFSSLIIHQQYYEDKMRNDIESKSLRNFMTYEVFENFSIIFLLFLNVSMLTGVAHVYFGFEENIVIYILILYFIFIPLIAKLIQKIIYKDK